MKRFLSTASQVAVAAFLTLATAQCTLVQADEIYDWSNTAANNNNAPPDGFPENMNYSEVNDAARELMAVVKRYVEAVDGTNTTAGTEPAYTLSSGQSLGAAAGHVHVWTAHATSTGGVTLNVDAAGAKNVVDAAGVQLGSGAIVQSGIYMTVEEGTNHRIIGTLSAPGVGSTAGTTTDNTIARFDGTSGTVIQDSGVTIDDSDNVAGVATLTTSGNIELGHASANTLSGSGGNVSVEGNLLYRAGGTDVPVTDGGNGRSTATAYAVITGGTTSTGAHQSVSGVGTDGQVLTSTGAGALPAWEAVPAISTGSVNSLVIQNNSGTPTTQIDVDSGAATIPDSSGVSVYVTSVNVTINAATTGANGLDAGSLANNTRYYVHLIHNGSAVAGLLSTSATSPTLPSGYTFSYRVGMVQTGGSATFFTSRQTGSLVEVSQVTTSGTAFDFLLPPQIKDLTVIFSQVSLSGTDHPIVQLGDSGGVETTSYSSIGQNPGGSNTSTSGYTLRQGNASLLSSGHMHLKELPGNVWISSHMLFVEAGATSFGGGHKVLSDELDRFRVTRSGTDTFDNGQVGGSYRDAVNAN